MTPKYRFRNGFTLVELMVALLISTGIVIALTRIYQTVAGAAVIVRSQSSDWSFEQFLRKQGLHALPFLGKDKPFVGEIDQCMFLTRYGAASASDGPPTVVHYRYDRYQRAVLYQEIRARPWWDEEMKPETGKDWLQRMQGAPEKPRVALRGLDEAEFFYYQNDPRQPWINRWPTDAPQPSLVKLRYRRVGEVREIIFELGAPLAAPVLLN